MAIDLEFRGIGEDILATIREAASLTAKFRGEVAATNDAQTKGAQQVIAAQEQVQATLEGSVVAVQELGKQSATQGKVLASELDKAGASATRLDGALSAVERTDLQNLVNEAKAVAAAQGAIIKPLDAQKKAKLDLLVRSKAITEEEAKLLGEVLETTDAFIELNEPVEKVEHGVGGIKKQIAGAKAEAQAMIQKFGEFSPQAITATKKVADLSDKLGDFNDRVRALNPDAKFQAFGQVFTSLAGGIAAANGAIGLFGDKSEDVQKALLKVQSALAITQGLQAFFGGFVDGLKNIRAVLGLTTVAQEASTVATEADTLAKGANATATVAVGTANTAAAGGVGVFTGALRTLAVVAAANPIGAIATALVAIGGLFLLLGDSSVDSTAKVDALLKKLQFFDDEAKRARSFRNELQDIQTELDSIGTDDSPAKQREAALRAQQRQVDILNEDLSRARENQAKLLDELANIDPASETAKENQDKLFALLDEQVKVIADAGAERVLVEQRTKLELAKIDDAGNKEAIDKAKQAAEERKRILAQLGNELEAIQKNVADRINAINLEEANPEQRLAIQRAAAEKEVNDLRTSELRKLAILQLVKDQRIKDINDLSQAEKDAAADAEIARGSVVLDPAREQQFQRLSLATWDAYFRDLSALQREQAEARIALLVDTQQKELAAFEAQLTAQAEILRTKGQATEAEVEAFKTKQRADFGAKQMQQARDIEEEIAVARLEAQKQGGDASVAEQEAIELEILNVKLRYAEASLAAIGEANDAETRKRKADLELLIANLRGAITKAQAERKPLDLFDLLGIDLTDKDKQRVNEAVGNVINLVEQSIAAQRAEVDAQISATDELIADRERRADNLRQQLDQEIELAKLGLANNVDAVRAQIAENDKAAAAEKVRKQKLVEESKKIARQQLAVDAAVQASALITTGANVFAAESLKGIVGVVGAIGFIASVIAAFISFKARANAINAGGGNQQFREGGSTDGMIEGSRHGSKYGESGIAMYDRKTGKEVGEMEGGEYIVNREVSLKHRDIVEAMNRNDITTVYDLARQEIMGTNTVRLSSERVKEVVETKTTYENHTTTFAVVENDKLRKDVQELTRVVKAFKTEQGKPKEQVVPIDGGYMVIKPNGDRETVRRKR